MFDCLWVVTWTMLVGEYDLTDNLCHRWDIELGTGEPVGDDWPVLPEGSGAYSGCGGILAVSHEAIARDLAALNMILRRAPTGT
jgi:hypothetical protein